jgi:uncharacterized membrane protein
MKLIQTLKEQNRLTILLLFIVTLTVCLTLVALRVHFTSKATFVFLVWNIFLAVIPYAISTILVVRHEKISNRWLLVFPFLAWLCFFPNAPYILTDLFHLRPRAGVPFWYDLALILFFAWSGLMLGYASLMDMQMIITRHFGRVTGWVTVIVSLILGSFGIYLGRYLRWNSWDVLSSPFALIKDIAVRVLDPADHPGTYGVTLIFSLFLIIGYLMLSQFAKAYPGSADISKS